MTSNVDLGYQSRRLPPWVWAMLVSAAAALLAYTTYRAFKLSITFDEAWSKSTYAMRSWGDILWFRPASANNHPGNSLLMKLSLQLLGDSTFHLRLPNLLAHLLYLIYSIALARRLRRPVWVLFCFFLLNFHPFLLDFFSLARGYGLAMAMVMGATYHLFAFRENAFSRHLALTVVCATLAVFFNFSFLHFFLGNSGVLILLIYSHAHAWNTKPWTAVLTAAARLLPLAAACVGLYLYMRHPIKALVANHELYYGGSTGFWADTVSSLAHAVLYKFDFWRYDVSLLLIVVQILLIAMFVTFAIDASERKFSLRASPGLLALLLVCLPALTSMAQHALTGSPFLIYRTALFWIPTFMLAVTFLLRTVAKVPELRKVTLILGVFITLALAALNAKVMNTTHTAEWPFDADTEQMMQDLQADVVQNGGGPTTIGLSWQLRSGVNYYRQLNHLDWLAEATQEGCIPGKDYYFVLNDGEGCKLQEQDLPFGKHGGYVRIKQYPISNTALWKSVPNPK